MVSANHDGILLTDVSLIAMADNCHKLKEVHIIAYGITDEGLVALVSSNPDLEDINIYYGKTLTDASLIASDRSTLS